MSTTTVYHKPTCTTCRQVYAALEESGVDFDAVDPPQAPMLRRRDAIREG
jgi:arsenate reductase-like glutaredoxin family protein